jgi:hypothetical protein
MMYVLSAEFIVIMEEPRETVIWFETNADLGANPRAVPTQATKPNERKDFIVQYSDFKMGESIQRKERMDIASEANG